MVKVLIYSGPCKLKYNDSPVNVYVDQYFNYRYRLSLVDLATHEPVGVATVNLPDSDLNHDEVFIKDYVENEGMVKFLTTAEIIEPTPTRIVGLEYADVRAYKFTPKVLAKLREPHVK